MGKKTSNRKAKLVHLNQEVYTAMQNENLGLDSSDINGKINELLVFAIEIKRGKKLEAFNDTQASLMKEHSDSLEEIKLKLSKLLKEVNDNSQ